ncbi:MAG: thioredoxin [Pirellulaceae bacterium]|nr:thioredoxin [Pirellulaceae bacterium]
MLPIQSVSQVTFSKEVLESPLPVVIDFYANWCGPCRRLAPTIERVAKIYAGQIKFVKVNTDDEAVLAEQFNVSSLPTLVFLDEGQVVSQFAGLISEEHLKSELNEWIARRNPAYP